MAANTLLDLQEQERHPHLLTLGAAPGHQVTDAAVLCSDSSFGSAANKPMQKDVLRQCSTLPLFGVQAAIGTASATTTAAVAQGYATAAALSLEAFLSLASPLAVQETSENSESWLDSFFDTISNLTETSLVDVRDPLAPPAVAAAAARSSG
ncbi:hypothetical protein ACQY0O_003662 [Thecaphora frezii]